MIRSARRAIALLVLVSCAGGQAASNDAPASDAVAVESGQFSGIEGEFTQGGWVRGRAPAGLASLSIDGTVVPVAEDGTFFAAFDRDAQGSATLSAIMPGGASVDRTFEISPRDWQISHVNVARGRGNDLEAYWAKREPEYNAIRDARAMRTEATGWQQDFKWPLKSRISGYFGRQRIYAGEPGSYHGGIDLAAGYGTPIMAPADGVVVLARTGFSLEGGILIVDHGAGLNSAFIHLSSLKVKEGQSVQQGQYIGDVGNTGRTSGPHLHWSLMWNDARIDPLLLAGPM